MKVFRGYDLHLSSYYTTHEERSMFQYWEVILCFFNPPLLMLLLHFREQTLHHIMGTNHQRLWQKSCFFCWLNKLLVIFLHRAELDLIRQCFSLHFNFILKLNVSILNIWPRFMYLLGRFLGENGETMGSLSTDTGLPVRHRSNQRYAYFCPPPRLAPVRKMCCWITLEACWRVGFGGIKRNLLCIHLSCFYSWTLLTDCI